jgi:hypothetical protein
MLQTEFNHRGLALEVASKTRKGRRSLSVEWAQREVAEENGVSVSTVQEAWKKYRRDALARLTPLGRKLSKSIP